MPAKFRVRTAEAVPARRQYVLRGEAIEGTIHPGMTLEIPLNSSLSVTATIACVGVSSASGRPEMELIVQNDEPGELDVLVALNVRDGEVLEIAES